MEMPLVSVCMTTYNHEAYLAQAIESVLAQQTSFGVELVVGEDCSTDRTAAICREYAAKYPDRIRLVTSPENVGWRANYRRTFEACRGKYVAYCDGDDWWSDPRKLQMQADLLRIPVDRPAMVETTAFGAAALAGLNCGMWESLEELSALRRSDRVFTPQRVQAECDDAYRMWKRAVQRAGDWIEH